jgi:RNA polymerase sigma-70 factor (ECF subfamily)
MLRRNGHEEPLDDEIDVAGPEGDDPERRAGDAELSARIRNVVMGMATNDRTVLMLRHFSELSYLEIGQILDLDEKTVKSRLFEARQRLRGLVPDLRDFSR